MENILPTFHLRLIKAGSGQEYGRVLAASGPAGIVDIKNNLGLITEDPEILRNLSDRMDLFAQVVRQLLREGGAISYSGGEIDFGFIKSLYSLDEETLDRLRREWIIGLHQPSRSDRREVVAKPWRVLVQPGIDQVLVPFLQEPGHNLKFSLMPTGSEAPADKLTRRHVLNEYLVGGALVNYAGILIPRGEFPRRISGSTLVKAAVLDVIRNRS